MAVSVEGVFRIEDKASKAMRDMELQAVQTDAAITALGAKLDRLEKQKLAGIGGAAGQLDKMESSARRATASNDNLTRSHTGGERAMAATEGRAKTMSREVEGAGTKMRGAARDAEHLGSAVRRVGDGADHVVNLGRVLSALQGPLNIVMAGFGGLSKVASMWMPMLIAAVIPLAPALLSVGQAAAALPGLLAAAAQAGVTGFLALRGVMAAVGAGFKEQQGAYMDNIQLGQQIAQQSHAVADAKFAETQANQGLITAQHGIVEAQRAEYDSQRQLTEARIEALRNLQDLKMAAEDAALGSQSAALQLERDRRTLAMGSFTGPMGDIEQQQAALSVQQDLLGVTKAHTTQQRANQDLTRAQHQPNMQLIQAQRGVSDAAYGMTQAQQGVASAQHAVADAAFSEQQAVQQLNMTLRFGSQAHTAYLMALRQLPPAAQEFVKNIVAMRPELQRLQGIAGQHLFPYLETDLGRIKSIIPTLEPILSATGGALGGGIDKVVREFTDHPRQIKILGDADVGLIRTGFDMLSKLLGALREFMVAAVPFAQWMANAFDAWAGNMEKSAGHTDKIRDSLKHAEGELHTMFDFFKSAFSIIGQLLSDMRPLSDQLWGGMNGGAKNFNDFLTSHKAQITGFFSSLYPVLHDIGQMLKAWAGVMGTLPVNPLKLATDLLDKIAGALKTIAGIPGLGTVLEGLIAVGVVSKLATTLSHVTGISRAVGAISRLSRGGSLLGEEGGRATSRLGRLGSAAQAMSAQPVFVVNWPGGALGGGGGPLGGRGRGRAAGVEGEVAAVEGEAAAAEGGGGLLSRIAGRSRVLTGIGRLGSGAAGLARGAGGRLIEALPIEATVAGLAGAQRVGRAGSALGRIGSGALRGVGAVASKLPFLDLAFAGLGAATTSEGHTAAGRLAGAAEMLDPTSLLSMIPGMGGFRGVAGSILHPLVHGGGAGAVAGGALAGAGTGALIGSLGGPLGAAIGAGAGGLIGGALSLFGGGGGESPAQRQARLAQQRAQTAQTEWTRLGGQVREAASTHNVARLQELGLWAGRTAESMKAAGTKGADAFSTLAARIKANVADAHSQITGPLQHSLNQIVGTYGFPAVARIVNSTTLSVQQKTRDTVKALTDISLHGTGPMVKNAKDALDDLRDHTNKTLTQAASDTDTQMTKLQTKIEDGSVQAKNAAVTNFGQLAGAITQAMKTGAEAADQGTKLLLQSLNTTLKSLGAGSKQVKAADLVVSMNPSQAQSAVSNIAAGYDTVGTYGGSAGVAPTIVTASGTKATGGRVPGGVGPDNWALVGPNGQVAGMVGGGELLVANRHTEARINAMLGGRTTLGAEVAGETRPHSYATGGLVPGHPELHTGVSQAGEEVLSRFPGLMVTSTTGGGHAAGSYHYKGEAIDIAGAVPLMLQAASWIKSSGLADSLTEGIHNPNLSVKYGKGVPSSYWGPAVWGEHANHIHMAVAGALTAAAAQLGVGSGAGGTGGTAALLQHVTRPSVKGTGAQADITRAMMRIETNAVNALIDRQNATAGGSPSGGGPPKGGVSGTVAQWLTRALRLTNHFSPSNLVALEGRTMQESGGNPHAINNWDSNAKAGHPSKGLLQTIDSTFSSYMLPGHADIWNPVDNAIAGIRYMFARYGHIVGASGSGYELGGRVGWGGWNAAGGAFTTNGPTLFGAGEGGRRETVSITPAGGRGSGASDRTINIDIGHITNHEEGDIKKILYRELQGLADDLDRVQHVG